MWFFRKLFGLFFVGLLILGIFGFFGGGRHGRYQEAYSQGYIDGQRAAASSESAAEGAESAAKSVPDSVPGANVYYHGHSFFFPGFGLLFCLVPLLFFGLMFMGMGRRRWYRGNHYGHWGRGSWGYDGPCGPRRWGSRSGWDEGVKEKSPEDIDDGPGADEPIYRA